MKARLNITIDAPLLAEVKKVAYKQKTSVSEIVENYLSTFVKMKKRKTLTELIDELPKKYISEDRDLIDEYYQAKLKKHGL